MRKVLKKTRWLGLEFFTNDAHADATRRILKHRLKWRSKAPEELVCESESKINSLTAAARKVAKRKTVLVQIIQPTKCKVLQFYYLTFMCGSTCSGRPPLIIKSIQLHC
jgi:hypothetical protein